MIKDAYYTLGCKVNQYETEKIRESLEASGITTVSFSSIADIYIINTCSVTAVADSKSRNAVRKAIRANPEALVVVCGCYAELEPVQLTSIEGVDMVISNLEKDTVCERVLARLGIEKSKADISKVVKPRIRTRAVVKVQDGCDNFCSYCIVPYARRGMNSRPIIDVLEEIETLARFGYKEIVLTGIRLGSYDADGVKVPLLISKVSEVAGIKRIRLSSIEPWEVDDALIDAMQNPIVCRHLHIPLQSGDDEILRLMNRPYSLKSYLKLINHIRNRIPDIGITTDVIVGFPGESESAFNNTKNAIKDAAFSRLHVFRYSKRKGTLAAEMINQVDSRIKKDRSDELIALNTECLRNFAEVMAGKVLEVLVEREAVGSNLLRGFADNYLEAEFPGAPHLKGEIVRVRIGGAGVEGLAAGEMIERV